jgi:integration host factor subunit alpha
MSKVITRADLIKMLMIKFNLSREEAGIFLKEIIFSICGALKESGSLKISSFGTFSVNQREERNGVNPRTKERMVIQSKKVLKFKPSSVLKESVRERSSIIK